MQVNVNVLMNQFIHTMHRHTDGVEKSSRKLSSGLQIQQAADNVSGLGISEKMRGQIRGLAQANRNIQDGVSLIQVAEGGLSGIHDTLQRIRELSVQAANDVLTNQDRITIQSEVDQLLEGVDHIANHTMFNTIPLLNVDMKDSYYNRYFDKVTEVPELPPAEETPPAPFLPLGWFHVSADEIGFKPQGDLQAIATNGTNAVIAGSGSDFLVFDPSKPEGAQWSKDIILRDADGKQIPHNYNNVFNDVFWDGQKYVALKENGAIFTSVNGLEWFQKINDISASDYTVKLQSIDSNGSSYVAVGWKEYGRYGDNLRIEQVMYTSSNLQEWTEVSIPPYGNGTSRLTDVIWNAEKDEYIAVGSTGLVARSSDGVEWNMDYHIGNYGNFTGITYGDGMYIAVTGDGTPAKIFTSEDGVNWYNNAQSIGPSLGATRYYGVKKTGEYFIAIGDETLGHAISKDGYNWMRVPTNNWNNFLKDSVQVGDKIIAVGDGQSRNTGIFILGPRDGDDPQFDEVENGSDNTANEGQHAAYPEGLILQVGPNSGDIFKVELSDVRTSSLRIDQISMLTNESANNAMKMLDKAIWIVSDQRSKYGAYQNALQHISNNVTNYEVNLTSAESRIRDTDMAKELLSSMKSSLLLQTNTTVISHSKVMAESVLQLLR